MWEKSEKLRESSCGRLGLGEWRWALWNATQKLIVTRPPHIHYSSEKLFEFMVWQIEKLRDSKFIFEPVDKQILKCVNVSELTMSVLRFFCSYPRPAIGVQIDEKFKRKWLFLTSYFSQSFEIFSSAAISKGWFGWISYLKGHQPPKFRADSIIFTSFYSRIIADTRQFKFFCFWHFEKWQKLVYNHGETSISNIFCKLSKIKVTVWIDSLKVNPTAPSCHHFIQIYN